MMTIETIGQEMRDFAPVLPVEPESPMGAYVHLRSRWLALAGSFASGKADSLTAEHVRALAMHSQLLHADALSIRRINTSLTQSLSAADARETANRSAMALDPAERLALAGSPFLPARQIAEKLDSADRGGNVACDLAAALSAVLALHSEAVAKACELSSTTAALHAQTAALRECERAESACNAKLEERTARLRRTETALVESGRDVEQYRTQRDAEGARADKAERLAQSRLEEAADFRLKHMVAADRADKAERQLAEYRAILAGLPFGITRAYPAALPLLRAYIADLESGK